MTRPARPIRKQGGPPRDFDSTAVKTFTVCLVLLISLMIGLLLTNLINDRITSLIYAVIVLILGVLAMIRTGFFKFAVPVASLGLGILATAAVFSLSLNCPHSVYMLCTFHLFIIFTAALVSYRRCDLLLSLFVALGSFALHYGFGRAGAKPVPTADDYLICTALVLISAVLIRHTLAARKRLYRRLETSSRENAAKADQLSALYQDLLQVTDEREEMAERYRLILETATSAILIAQDGFIKFSNHRTLEMFGFSWEELSAMPFTDIIHSDDRDMVLTRHRERLAGGTPPPSYSFRALDKAGNTLWLQIHSVATLWDKQPATLNFIQDITNHKLMEQQIQQSQKMEAIGTLAGGIAHDFNNILSGIFAYLQLAENHAEQSERVKKDIAQIRLGADKAADLCRQILLISRKSEPQKENIPLAGIIREVVDLMRATLPATITIQESLETGALIHADPGKIHQVVLNLCTNAFQAMADAPQGLLEISLDRITVFQDPSLSGRGIPPGEYLCLTVRDNGHGMDLTTQEKLFDPYFTTKAPGKGTGLGLAVALGIIEDHKGHVRVFSQKEKGSEFQVFLPTTDKGPSVSKPDPGLPDPAAHQGCLLIVEDEDLLGQAVTALLEDSGYEVVCCREAGTALEQFQSQPGRFDLVLSDEMMPGMTGSDLIRRIKALSPQTPAILYSGNTTIITEEDKVQADAFVPKPLDTDQLVSIIHRLLNREPPGPALSSG